VKRLDEAVGYAARGWPVFPLEGKRPLKGSRGFRDSTTDLAVIESWWSEHPDWNIGIATGSGLLVVDVDAKSGGLDTLHGLPTLPATPSSVTGGGGQHFFFTVDRSLKSKNSAFSGIDVKAGGGYVVAPSSRHPSGRRYEWDDHPDEIKLAPAPAWLLDKLTEKKRTRYQGGTIHQEVRNVTLTQVAGGMRRMGLSRAAMEAALQLHNQQHCTPPLPDSEVRKIAKSVSRYPTGPAWATLGSIGYAATVAKAYGLDPNAEVVLREVVDAVRDRDHVFLGRRELARRCRLSSQKVTDNAIAKLDALGILHVDQEERGKRGKITLLPLPSLRGSGST
jgi:hypothetical protein